MKKYLTGGHFITGFVVGGIYIFCLSNKDIRFRIRILKKEKLFFIVVNIILVSILILQLVFIEYPALMNYDAWDQFTQVVTNNLNAHHTIMHTMIIKLCISLSGIFTTDLTVAAFIYGILQCVIGSIVETYSIFVIYKKTKNYIFSIVLTLMYILFPICSEMMVFITKDSAYSIAVLFLISFLLYHYEDEKLKIRTIVGIFIGGVGVCTLRANGFLVFLAVFLLSLIVKINQKRKIIIIFGCVMICSLFTNKLLTVVYQIDDAEYSERLSIPIQQISYVVVKDGDITEEQRNTIEKAISTDFIKEYYNPICSDVIKYALEHTAGEEQIKDNLMEYLKLWINLGLKNPKLYLEAWIKQTDGFWNPFEYESAREWDGPGDYSMILPIEIKGNTISDSLQHLRVEWEYLSKTIWGIRVFSSIGFCTWLNIMLFFLFMARKSSYTIFPAFNLANLITLLLSTPLNNGERYCYSMYISTGFLILIGLNSIKKEE